jgi:hypothetical protein
MPYASAYDPDLPPNVKKLDKKKREKWVATWNSVYRDCKSEKGDDCEGKAFRIANGTVKKNEIIGGSLG